MSRRMEFGLLRAAMPAAVWLAIAAPAAAQRRPAAPASPETPVKVTVSVSGRAETLRGTGRCSHEPRGWIYGRPAALWTVQYAGSPARRVSLTYWRMSAGGGDQFALSVQRGKAMHRIVTVKGEKPEGRGRSAFRPTALGGRFEVTGSDQAGVPLKVTIECAHFGGIAAEGG